MIPKHKPITSLLACFLLAGLSLLFVQCQSQATTAVVSKAQWMKSLPDTLQLCQMSIPGSHDSGAMLGGEALQTQDVDIPTQLGKGVRAFDIRLQATDTLLGVYHSVAFQHIYWETHVLPAFLQFLQDNPSETLIVSLKREGGSPEEYASLLAASLSAAEHTPHFVPLFRPDITLGECRGKILFLHRDKAMDNYPGAACSGWEDDATCLLTLQNRDGEEGYARLQDEYQYESGNEARMKYDACIGNLQMLNSEPADSLRWGISYASATGLPQGTPRLFADSINAPLANYIEHNKLARCGIIFIDFIGLPAGEKLVNTIISCNP